MGLAVIVLRSFFQALHSMFYIHQIQCISPQQTFNTQSIGEVKAPVDNKLAVAELAYEDIPRNVLRRMSKAMRIAVACGMPVIQNMPQVNGIVLGTANGGMEDSIIFLNQVIEYDEGILTPGSFVQSTANAAAAQLSLATTNRNYNITHVHRGLAFENAVLDVAMQLKEHPAHEYLLGGVDEISTYNYRLEYIDGWYKTEPVTIDNFYSALSPGSVAGEGAVMLQASNKKEDAIAYVHGMLMLHTSDIATVKNALQAFLAKHNIHVDVLLSGENGDSNLQPYYDACATLFNDETAIVRFKHLCGEYPTASSFGLWFASKLIGGMPLPAYCLKKKGSTNDYKTVLMYNNHKKTQHSFMLVTVVA